MDGQNPPYLNYEGAGNFTYCRIRYGGNSNGSANANITYTTTASGYFNNSSNEFSANYGFKISNSTFNIDQSIVRENAFDGLNTSNSSTLTMSGTQVLNNVEDGLYFNSSIATLNDNDFSDNGGYGAYLTSATIKGVSGSSGSGNGINGIGLSGSVTVNQTWLQNDVDFPVILLGTVTVLEDISLTIPGPMVIKADSAGQLTVQGTLNINGNRRDQMVVFTSLNDDEFAGNTDGGSSSPFPGSWLGIYVDSYGILISGNSSPNLGSSSASDKGNNSIKNNNNGDFQLRNESASSVNAYYNFWQIADSAQIDSSIIYDDDENAGYGKINFSPCSISIPVSITRRR